MESLAKGGGLDLFGFPRGTYFAPSDKYDTFLEHLLRYGNIYQKQIVETANSLFGASSEIMIPEPKAPEHVPWPLIKKLTEEKEVAGIYISGHPLDDYRIVVDHFTSCALGDTERYPHRPCKVSGIVVAANHGIDSKGNGRGFFTLQDYSSSIDVSLWRDDYQKFKHLFEVGQCLYIRGVYEPRWRGAEQFAFNIKDAKQLAEMEDSIVDSITIKVMLEKVTTPFIKDFTKMVTQRKGKNKLKLEIVDVEERLILPMYSRTFKVKVDNEFIDQLEEMSLQYSLE